MNGDYEYEEVSLTVVKRLNKKRMIFLLLIILFILFMILIYICNIHKQMVQLSNKNDTYNNGEYANIEDRNDNDGINGDNKPDQNMDNNPNIKIPTLTEVGKNNIANIYETTEKVAYITFDDGPSSNVTPQVLNILNQYNIKATFFVLGRNTQRYPDLVKQEYLAGHYIANHGYSHEYDTIYSSAQMVLDEYINTEQLIRNAIGVQEYSSHLFRFPGGSGGKKYRAIKDEAKQLLSDNNILYIDWNSLTNDSIGHPTAESIIKDLKDTVGTKNSIVVLMHDTNAKQLTADMLPQILNYLIQQGYTFKTFYDVIQ